MARVARALTGALMAPMLSTSIAATSCTHHESAHPTPVPTATVTPIPTVEVVDPATTSPQLAAPSKYTACSINEGGLAVLGASDPSLGPADAPVTMLAFQDLQCPFCKRAHETVSQVGKKYGTMVRIVWKHQPLSFHAQALPAAEVAQGIYEQGGAKPFWRFVDMVFESQEDISDGALLDIAQEAGARDRSRLRDAIENQTWKKKIDDDLALATAMGSRGTPHFFINGRELTGAQPLEKFTEIIDDEIAQSTRNGALSGVASMALGCERMKNAVADLIASGSGVNNGVTAATGTPSDETTVWKIPVAGSPSRGPDTALVTIVQFADFQCPFCKRVETTLADVRAKYGDKVRIVWKDEPLPFHPRAEPSAELAREALAQKGAAGFWAVHDALFASAPKLENADLLAIAKANGVSTTAASSAISTHKHKKAIDADSDLADDFQAGGTPHFFINGRRLVGAQPLEKFTKMIDEEMVKAQALVAKGTAPRSVYDQTIANGAGPAVLEKKNVPLPAAGSHAFRGPATAKVTIQMFADFQCPFCQRSLTTMDQIVSAYPTNVRILWRHMPLAFHANAMLAAEAAEEAFVQGGNKSFWDMHDLLFKNQATPNGLERAAIEGYASQLGLDMKRFKAALDGHTHQAKIKADAAVASTASISGTPSFVINGFYVSGAQPFAKFKKLIDTALKAP